SASASDHFRIVGYSEATHLDELSPMLRLGDWAKRYRQLLLPSRQRGVRSADAHLVTDPFRLDAHSVVDGVAELLLASEAAFVFWLETYQSKMTGSDPTRRRLSGRALRQARRRSLQALIHRFGA